MKTVGIDYLNIALMLVSCAAAFALPFEVFLFSYAVLGPLHYLTELSWLHRRNYFTLKGGDWWILYGAALLFFVFANFNAVAIKLSGPNITNLADLYRTSPGVALVGIWMRAHLGGVVLFAFGTALMMVLLKTRRSRLAAYAALAVASFALVELGNNIAGPRLFFVLFGLFMITVVHVFVFTAAFILYGALKSNSKVGLASIGVLAACAVSCFVFRPEGQLVSDYVKDSYDSLRLVNIEILRLLSPNDVLVNGQLLATSALKDVVYNSSVGVALMRFIAFAYTYHYLNWFSKTQIIRWHEVPRFWFVSIFVLWGLSIALYAYDFNMGIFVLAFLSATHVFLEFPLNWISFKGIGEEIGKALGGRIALART